MIPSLTFFCPACSSRLTVPVSMAGVQGPCPVCSSVIEAPQPAMTSALPAVPVIPAPPPAPHSPPLPSLPPPAPASPLPSPEVSAAPYHPVTASTAATIPPPKAPQATNRSILTVEPRASRTRLPDQREAVTARPISEQHLVDPSQGNDYRVPAKSHSRITPRVLISCCALLVMAGVSFALISFTKEKAVTPKLDAAKTKQILPDEPAAKPSDATTKKTPAVVPKNSVPTVTAAKPESRPDAPATPQSPPAGKLAMTVVEKFLAAKSLQERLPLIATKATPSELENSVLAKEFPSEPRVSPDFQETSAEGYTDFYYNIDFKDPSGKPSAQLLLVRATPGESPKILVDPFLDSFGGRLAEFAGTPSAKTATVQVIISAVAHTTSDRNIPNHENKLRLKLMSRDNEKEIASAYFTKLSKLGQMLVTEGSGFRYGQARTAKVSLRWNREEDPANPFLEVTDIKEFRWNP